MPSPIHLDRLDLPVHRDAPEVFRTPNEDLGPLLGAQHLGGTLIELPPGNKAFPYHWEAAQEEWLIVLSGRPTVRTPSEREVLDPGDVVCFEAGPDGAHQVINETDEACRLV